MHNRVGDGVDSREIAPLDGAVLVPLVAVIVLLAVYPQLALRRSENSTKASVLPAQAALATGDYRAVSAVLAPPQGCRTSAGHLECRGVVPGTRR
jgi:hypothetical protein